MEQSKNEEKYDSERDDAYLQDVDDGCGCTEIWEHLSEQRAAEKTDSP
ncbi:hypothetical protein HT576_19620 [Haloterrigena sp. SYSU A121-1]|uniref:Uncharacterized protein n=1 Tax=Haloterrigena gelatinilytica TaxID=2741724 RepID=A0A8J8GRM4_9EURY|nr:hypothetical protein [Haloterrigena gelatinilytica]NUB93219.1 hypothetical protein [Haloterrigena gelatinilytica]